ALDSGIAIVVIGVGVLLGVLAAVLPALWAGRSSLVSLVASGAARAGGDRGRMRRGMIVAQVALSLVLLNCGALVVRSLEQLLRADAGFEPRGVVTALVRTPPVFFADSEIVPFQDGVAGALAELPGVTAVSAVTALPLTANTVFAPETISIPDAPGNTGDREADSVVTDVIGARAGYFEIMGMRLVAGRTFAETRVPDVHEALIDTTLARRFFPTGNAVGATVPYGDGKLTIVGVVAQARLYDVHEDGRPQMYVRAEDFGYRPLFYVLRTTRSAEGLVPEIRSAVRRVDSRVAVGEVRTMEQIVGNALRQQRTSAALVSAFALSALLLAAMGLFGVVAESVLRRRHEIAVRLAVGADYRGVLRLVLREAALLIVIGVLIGLPGVYAAGGLIRGALVGVQPSDPLTTIAVALGLALVTLVTCYVPARRTLQIDPAQLFRAE
ncbi:MAG TPA: FtsX-like permease family protein, partial [Gammaproteobacteria bacterium]|nr:FtsX-like permease family protein [Gammaproteobacteria bacterium]